MRKYLYSENGFTEKAEWQPNCWVNVECPDNDDFKFLTEELKVPESFLEDDTREALMVTPLWFVLLGAGWLFAGKKRLAK